jgi:hypothetical protein
MVEPGASRHARDPTRFSQQPENQNGDQTRDEIRNEKAGWRPAALENFNWLRWVPGRS